MHLEKAKAPGVLVLLPGKSHGRRSLVGCSPWCGKESDMTERVHFHFSLSCLGEGSDNPLQCSCLENPRDRGTWWAAVYGVAQSRTRLKRLSSSSSSRISSVAPSCLTLCDPMHRSTSGLPVHHQLLEFTQTHVHWVSDAIQPPHPLPPAFSLSQHQGLFKWVSSLHQVAKVLEFQLQHQSFQWTCIVVIKTGTFFFLNKDELHWHMMTKVPVHPLCSLVKYSIAPSMGLD